jgi:hypothetical protein
MFTTPHVPLLLRTITLIVATCTGVQLPLDLQPEPDHTTPADRERAH